MDLKILVFDNIVCSAGPIVIIGNNTLSPQTFASWWRSQTVLVLRQQQSNFLRVETVLYTLHS